MLCPQDTVRWEALVPTVTKEKEQYSLIPRENVDLTREMFLGAHKSLRSMSPPRSLWPTEAEVVVQTTK